MVLDVGGQVRYRLAFDRIAMKARYWYTILATCACALIGPAQVFASDTLLLHGHIYTGNPKMRWAESLAISGTRIDAIGSDKDMSRRRRGTQDVVDLHGRTVI